MTSGIVLDGRAQLKQALLTVIEDVLMANTPPPDSRFLTFRDAEMFVFQTGPTAWLSLIHI